VLPIGEFRRGRESFLEHLSAIGRQRPSAGAAGSASRGRRLQKPRTGI